MTAPARLTTADQALVHALTVLATAPWGIGTDEADLDDRFRTILAVDVLPRVTRANPALRQLVEVADRVVATRGGLGAQRHDLRAPLNAWHRARLCASVTALNERGGE